MLANAFTWIGAAIRTSMANWVERIAPERAQLHFIWIEAMAFSVFYAVFVPLLLLEMSLSIYGFSALIATLWCYWFVCKVCLSISIQLGPFTTLRAAVVLAILRGFQLFVFLIMAPFAFICVLGSMVDGLFHMIHGAPLMITFVGFCLIRREIARIEDSPSES